MSWDDPDAPLGSLFGEVAVFPPTPEEFATLHGSSCPHGYDDHGHGPFSSNCRATVRHEELDAWAKLEVGQAMDLPDGADNPGECTCVLHYRCDDSTGWTHALGEAP